MSDLARLLLLVAGSALIVIGCCVGVLLALRRSLLGDGGRVVQLAEAYLGDLRASRYPQAYDRLCHLAGAEDAPAYAARMERQRIAGRGISGYDLAVAFTKETLDLTSAQGTVRFTDGREDGVLYELQRVDDGDPGCLVAYDGFSRS